MLKAKHPLISKLRMGSQIELDIHNLASMIMSWAKIVQHPPFIQKFEKKSKISMLMSCHVEINKIRQALIEIDVSELF